MYSVNLTYSTLEYMDVYYTSIYFLLIAGAYTYNNINLELVHQPLEYNNIFSLRVRRSAISHKLCLCLLQPRKMVADIYIERKFPKISINK